MAEIIPAIIAPSQKELEEKINSLEKAAKKFQLDIMDGKFVPNRSLDFNFKLPPNLNLHFEAHLMVVNPAEWIKKYWQKVETILSPIETCQNPAEILKFLKNKKRVGFALNPKTPIDKIKNYLSLIDQVLILTVEPGFYGGKFLPQVLEKVRALRKLKPDLDIEVDGGINPKTIKMVAEAGANLLVSGSYIFNSKNPRKAIHTLENLVKEN